jgi:hypothetical protein
MRRVVALGVAFFLSACAESPTPCVVSSLGYAARYTYTHADPGCAIAPGDVIGLESYPGQRSGSDEPDPGRRSLAVQSRAMAALRRDAESFGVSLGASSSTFAFGPASADADEEGLCHAGTDEMPLAPAEVAVPKIVTKFPFVIPARHFRQTWSDVTTFVTADVPGTFMKASMTMEDVLQGCATEYTVLAMAPAVYCGVVDFEGSEHPEDSVCAAAADPAAGRLFGLGIDPRFEAHCDPDIFHCVPTRTPPGW